MGARRARPSRRGVTAWFRDGRIWHELGPVEDELVIRKPSYGAFYDTPLRTVLWNLGRDTVIICGTLSNFCCGATARQAYGRGFYLVFGSDITATDDAELHEAELEVLRNGFARVMSADEILDALAPSSSVELALARLNEPSVM